MLRQLLPMLLFSLFFNTAIAQPEGFTRGTMKYNGVEYPCYTKTFDVAADVVEASVLEKMKTLGFKNTGKKGVMIFRNVSVPTLNNGERCDAFAKVESKGKKGATQSVISIVVTQPGAIEEGKASKNAADAVAGVGLVAVSDEFHDDMNESVAMGQYNAQLNDLKNQANKAEKQLAELENERASLEKRLEKARKDLENNAKEIEKKKAEVIAQKKLLEEKTATVPLKKQK
jgi:hypothetical protein